jgi:parvulin-like peptidyl-prolyl isomerase
MCQAGGISEPLKSDEGYQILRVDARTAGSNTPTFNEMNVRQAITMERLPKEREDYLQRLLNDAYVSIGETYRAAVDAFAEDRAARRQ